MFSIHVHIVLISLCQLFLFSFVKSLSSNFSFFPTDISEVGDFGKVTHTDQSATTSKPASNSVEDSIIFVKANSDSNPGNPDEASTLREELQTMNREEASNWLQLGGNVGRAEEVIDENNPASKWKHCRKYQRKKVNQNNQTNPLEQHLEILKMKKSLTVHPSYITLQNQSGTSQSGDPMSRLVNVDKSRSLMTQEYVSSVLSAVDSDLSYSVFEREKNLEAGNAPVTRPPSPRQREPDPAAPATVIRRKPLKALRTIAPKSSPTASAPGMPVIALGSQGSPSTMARFHIVGHRLASPVSLNPSLRLGNTKILK